MKKDKLNKEKNKHPSWLIKRKIKKPFWANAPLYSPPDLLEITSESLQDERKRKDLNKKHKEQMKQIIPQWDKAFLASLNGDKEAGDKWQRWFIRLIEQGKEIINDFYKNVVDRKMESLRQAKNELLSKYQIIINQGIAMQLQKTALATALNEAENECERIKNLAIEIGDANIDNSEILTEINNIIEEITSAHDRCVDLLEELFTS